MELWDVYDINRKCTGKVIDRHSDEKLKEGEYHIVVETILINSNAIFYKTLRDDNAKDFKDIWIFRKDLEIQDLNYVDGEVIDSKWVTINEFEKMINNKEIIPTIDFAKEDYKKCLELK